MRNHIHTTIAVVIMFICALTYLFGVVHLFDQAHKAMAFDVQTGMLLLPFIIMIWGIGALIYHSGHTK